MQRGDGVVPRWFPVAGGADGWDCGLLGASWAQSVAHRGDVGEGGPGHGCGDRWMDVGSASRWRYQRDMKQKDRQTLGTDGLQAAGPAGQTDG